MHLEEARNAAGAVSPLVRRLFAQPFLPAASLSEAPTVPGSERPSGRGGPGRLAQGQGGVPPVPRLDGTP